MAKIVVSNVGEYPVKFILAAKKAQTEAEAAAGAALEEVVVDSGHGKTIDGKIVGFEELRPSVPVDVPAAGQD
jgi:hypothetical protein